MNGTPLVGSPIARVPPTAIKLGMCGFTIGREAYYRQFDVVEIQQTFYDPPAPETLVRWRSEAPAAFEFTMKAWQVVTHLGTSRTYRRLRPPFSERQRSEAGAFRSIERPKGISLMWERAAPGLTTSSPRFVMSSIGFTQ